MSADCRARRWPTASCGRSAAGCSRRRVGSIATAVGTVVALAGVIAGQRLSRRGQDKDRHLAEVPHLRAQAAARVTEGYTARVVEFAGENRLRTITCRGDPSTKNQMVADAPRRRYLISSRTKATQRAFDGRLSGFQRWSAPMGRQMGDEAPDHSSGEPDFGTSLPCPAHGPSLGGRVRLTRTPMSNADPPVDRPSTTRHATKKPDMPAIERTRCCGRLRIDSD
jgi:hypothetical protein